MPDEVWARYVHEYHDARPGITEDVLSGALDEDGRSPYGWLVEAVPEGVATVVDLACGSGPVARRLPGIRVVGVDQSAGELARTRATDPCARVVRARAAAVPLAGGAADAVVSSMALMLLAPVEAVLAEAHRLLRPGGIFAATVPVRGSPSDPVFAEILDALGQTMTAYPMAFAAGSAADGFSSAGFTLARDESALFSRTVGDRSDAALVVRSFYAPGADPTRVEAAVAGLERRLAAGPIRIGYRIRRLVAVR